MQSNSIKILFLSLIISALSAQFKDEVSQRLEIYHQRHLQGLEDSKKIPLNKNIRKAVASLKYVK